MKLQTLGDAIDARMESRSDSPAAAALALGVTVDELHAWMADEYLPEPGRAATVLRYLEVDGERYRGLCLRSQMRRVQSTIRNGPSAARSARPVPTATQAVVANPRSARPTGGAERTPSRATSSRNRPRCGRAVRNHSVAKR